MEQLRKMTNNWSRYRIEDGTLEALFSNGYSSIGTLQSITEPDLSKLRELKIPGGQISLLRRFVGCLNCKQHPPVYSGAGRTDAFMRTGVGLVPSLVTSTTETTVVSRSHETNPATTRSYDSELTNGVGPSTGNSENSEWKAKSA